MPLPVVHRSRIRLALATVALTALAACGPAVVPADRVVNDPDEQANRAMHDFNVGVDRAVIRPVSLGYGQVVPEPVRAGLSNASDNLDQPLLRVNNILQLRLDDALQNTFRFLGEFHLRAWRACWTRPPIWGFYAADTDFGETMHVWGLSEGAMSSAGAWSLDQPRHGWPAGRRGDEPHAAGLRHARKRLRHRCVGCRWLNTRYELGDEIDRLYYDSADGYRQARILYLQNRRFELRNGSGEAYLDPYQGVYDDPYSDPYEDPYAQ